MVLIYCLETGLSGFLRGRPDNPKCITLNIYATKTNAIAQSKRAIELMCEKHCKDVVLNSEKDQSSIGKLNTKEVTAFLIRLCHSVFTLDTTL